MKSYIEDIICAQATPHGVGAISVVRASGKGALELLADLTGKPTSHFIPNTATYHKVYDKKDFLDEVMITFYKSEKSFTGEDSFEVSTHGSPFIVSSFLKRFRNLGARSAEPGEFSFRSYVNGKMDLSKAEGIHYAIQSKSELSKDISLNLLEGSFKKQILEIKEHLVWAASRVEASIDFSDQDIDLDHDEEVFDKINKARLAVDAFLKTYEIGAVQAKGVSVALCGPPNAGKSTMFNVLLDEERSIVSEQAGTTRDYITHSLSVSGHPVQLVDTAGLRETTAEVESAGIERSVALAKSSQLILFLVSKDSFKDANFYFDKISGLGVPLVLIHTKQDIEPWSSNLTAHDSLNFSYKSSEDSINLKSFLESKLEPYLSVNRNLFVDRHRDLLGQAFAVLVQLKDFHEISGFEDVISSLLYSCIEFVDEILYIEDPEVVRNKIFKDFCLGK
jgi:tRNA modification GTPase